MIKKQQKIKTFPMSEFCFCNQPHLQAEQKLDR